MPTALQRMWSSQTRIHKTRLQGLQRATTSLDKHQPRAEPIWSALRWIWQEWNFLCQQLLNSGTNRKLWPQFRRPSSLSRLECHINSNASFSRWFRIHRQVSQIKARKSLVPRMFNTIIYRYTPKRTVNSTHSELNPERTPSPAAAIKSTKPNSQTNDEPLIHNYAKNMSVIDTIILNNYKILHQII